MDKESNGMCTTCAGTGMLLQVGRVSDSSQCPLCGTSSLVYLEQALSRVKYCSSPSCGIVLVSEQDDEATVTKYAGMCQECGGTGFQAGTDD